MTLSSSTSKLLADLQETSSELTTTLFNLPRIGPLEDDAISVNDKTQFSQQLKKVRASLASIHQSLHNTPEWYTDGATITTTATTTDTATSLSSKPCKQAILSTALTCIVQCRGWILARALTNDLPRVLLKKLDEHITPPLDSICFMLLYGSKMGTMDRCHVAHAILDVPIDAMKDSSTIHLNGVDVQIVVALIKLQHYRLVLQNFSDLPSSVRLQLIQGSSNKQKGSKASEALTPLIDAFLAFVDQYGASLAAWTTDDALLALVLTGGSNAWTQLVVMLAFLGYQQSTETFSHWEQSVLHGILNGTSISAIIFTEAWSIVVRHYSISHLQSTISALCKLLQRTYSIIPLRDRLSNLIGRLIIRLPTPETSAILNELLVPLQTAGHAFGDKIETTLGLFAHFPLEALPTTCQELIVNTVERRVTQILDTLSMMIIDNKSRKKDINAILALTIPVQCLANIIECTRSCAPLKNIDRVIKRIPQLLKECHICATEQPNRLVEVTHSIHALIVLATLVTGVTSTIACEILSFLTQWMTLDPTGLGKYYAIRFAGSCGEIQFQDVEKIKAFNLLSRLFAATWQTDSIFIRHETFTQFTRFATKTPHIDLTVRLAPAHIQEELASFMAKQATAFPPKQESNNKNLTKSVQQLAWLSDLFQQQSGKPINFQAISTIIPKETINPTIMTTADNSNSNNSNNNNSTSDTSDEVVTRESCIMASQVIRKYIRIMKRQTTDTVDPTLVKSLLTLRRELDALDTN